MKDWGLIHSGKLPRLIAHLLRSVGFETGVSGWEIQVGGDAEFQNVTVAAVAGADHGALGGLADDDHTQYLKERGSGGAATDVPTHAHSGVAEAGTVDHGVLDGLGDDDHAHYCKERLSGGLAVDVPSHDHSEAAEAGQVDHGDLGGRGGDDHVQYSLVDGTRAFTGAIEGTSVEMSGNVEAGGGLVVGSVAQTPVTGVATLKDVSAPSTPASGYGHLYVAGDKLYFKDDGGESFLLSQRDRLYLGAGQWYADGPSVAVTSGILSYRISGTSSIEYMRCNVPLPPGWEGQADVTANLWWASVSTGTGTVEWMLHAERLTPGSLMTVFGDSDYQTPNCPGVANQVVKTTFSMDFSSWSAGDAISWALGRVGADDTDDNDVRFFALEVHL